MSAQPAACLQPSTANSERRHRWARSVLRKKVSADLSLNEGLIPSAGTCQLLGNSPSDPGSCGPHYFSGSFQLCLSGLEQKHKLC